MSYVIFFNNRLKKPQSFYLLITCNHSGNLTVLTRYQFHNFIHNEHTGVPHSRKALSFTIIIFHSENILRRKYASYSGFSSPVYTAECTAGSRWSRLRCFKKVQLRVLFSRITLLHVRIRQL